MTDEHTEALLVENSVKLLTDFFQVVSDGYNPAMIFVTTRLDRNLEESEYFVKPNHYGGSNEKYFETILATKKAVNDVTALITENFQRCLDHLASFSEVPTLFQSSFHMENLNALVQQVKDRVVKLIENWEPITNEYTNGYERRIIIAHGRNKTLVIEFGCFIH